MPGFSANGIELAFERHGEGTRPILLIHVFGSSGKVNWIDTGWVETLAEAGYAPVTFDNRGHGASQKLYDARLYFAHEMAEDARRLLDHLGIERARSSAIRWARASPPSSRGHGARVSAAVWGGMGTNLVSGLEDSEEIIEALTAESLEDVKGRVGRQFRIFADHNKADRAALAACMVHLARADEGGGRARHRGARAGRQRRERRDGGSAEALVRLLPRGRLLTIERRDHLRATGDPQFKRAALDFLARRS